MMRCLAVVAELLAEPRVHGARVSHEADPSKNVTIFFALNHFYTKWLRISVTGLGDFLKSSWMKVSYKNSPNL